MGAVIQLLRNDDPGASGGRGPGISERIAALTALHRRPVPRGGIPARHDF